MPKLIVNAMNDYFWSPDHSYHYLDQLPGVNYLRLLPNAEHSTAGSGISTKHYFLRRVLLSTNDGVDSRSIYNAYRL